MRELEWDCNCYPDPHHRLCPVGIAEDVAEVGCANQCSADSGAPEEHSPNCTWRRAEEFVRERLL